MNPIYFGKNKSFLKQEKKFNGIDTWRPTECLANLKILIILAILKTCCKFHKTFYRRH
jgi:hypothetical protein